MDSVSQSKITKENPIKAGDPISASVAETGPNPFLKRKRKLNSKMWGEFKKIQQPDGSHQVVCNRCNKDFIFNKTEATTQYKRNMSSCYARALSLRGHQKLTVNKNEDVVSFENWKWDIAKVRETLAHMILVHELLFNFVEYEIFNRFMRVCCPKWEKISRATSKKDCESVTSIN